MIFNQHLDHSTNLTKSLFLIVSLSTNTKSGSTENPTISTESTTITSPHSPDESKQHLDTALHSLALQLKNLTQLV